jgi:hypothetical protein
MGDTLKGLREGYLTNALGLADTQYGRLGANINAGYASNADLINNLKKDLLLQAQRGYLLGNKQAAIGRTGILGSMLSRGLTNAPYAASQAAAGAAETGLQLGRERNAQETAAIADNAKAMQELNLWKAGQLNTRDLSDTALRMAANQANTEWGRSDTNALGSAELGLQNTGFTASDRNATLLPQLAAQYANIIPGLESGRLQLNTLPIDIGTKLRSADLGDMGALTNLYNNLRFTGITDNTGRYIATSGGNMPAYRAPVQGGGGGGGWNDRMYNDYLGGGQTGGYSGGDSPNGISTVDYLANEYGPDFAAQWEAGTPVPRNNSPYGKWTPDYSVNR